MKKTKLVKASLFTLILAFMAIGTVAIAKEVMKKGIPVKEKRAVTQIWNYNGGPSDSPTDPSKYSLSTGEPCGTLQETVCKLNAPASATNPNQPDMHAEVEVDGEIEPQTIAQRISAALAG